VQAWIVRYLTRFGESRTWSDNHDQTVPVIFESEAACAELVGTLPEDPEISHAWSLRIAVRKG
jgi:hypothetical protein